ncbi:MAG TPA: hypothetical protein PKI71_11485, partial [Candidatus Rifleibacterium sp.]|nr:hypothetical protein [Candidatus Rifleibacterium sp.]
TVPVLMWEYDENKSDRLDYEKTVELKLKESNFIPINKRLCEEREIEDYRPRQYHIGPMAGAFNKAFGINGNRDSSYAVGDAIGVALRAIQELAEIVDEQAATIAELRAALNLPEKQKKQKKQVSAEFTAEEIEKAADKHVKAAYDNIMQELKQ